MGTRTFAQVPPTAATIALNAYIYGYAGHSLVTPHTALKQLWWTDDRIQAKVTRHYVVSQIRGEERGLLDKPLAFGEGLTDHTYMEWILDRARRLFLILSMVGRPEHIFSLIDDSLDDDDLPFSLQNVIGLELSIESDDRLSKKFYDVQFQYLLRQLNEGSHVDYGSNEHIPMEHVHRLPPAVSLQCWDRVHFPNVPDTIYLRRKFPFGADEMRDRERARFLQDISTANSYKHEHIVPVWASYTTADAGFTLSDFVPEHTLGTFIAHRQPHQWMRIPAIERPVILLEWMHCLADALASLHTRGTFHGAIRPSNILIDYDNRIAFPEVGALRPFNRGNKNDRSEILDYAAPETQQRRSTSTHTLDGMPFLKGRRQSSSSSSSNTPSYFSIATVQASTNPASSPQSPQTPTFRNFSRHISGQFSSPASPGTSPPSTPGISTGFSFSTTPSLPFPARDLPSTSSTSTPSVVSPQTPGLSTPFSPISRTPSSPSFIHSTHETPAPRPEAIDIFALGATFLDLLTFILKGKLNDFTKFRASHPPLQSTKSSRSFKATSDDKKAAEQPPLQTNAETLLAWIQHLHIEYAKHPPSHPALKAFPALLDIVATMLNPSPELRPDARRIRDRIEGILEKDAEIETLCCKNREWEGVVGNDDGSGSGKRRGRVRDSVSTGYGTASTGTSGARSLVGVGNGVVGEGKGGVEKKVEKKKRKLGLGLPWRRRVSVTEAGAEG